MARQECRAYLFEKGGLTMVASSALLFVFVWSDSV